MADAYNYAAILLKYPREKTTLNVLANLNCHMEESTTSKILKKVKKNHKDIKWADMNTFLMKGVYAGFLWKGNGNFVIANEDLLEALTILRLEKKQRPLQVYRRPLQDRNRLTSPPYRYRKNH